MIALIIFLALLVFPIWQSFYNYNRYKRLKVDFDELSKKYNIVCNDNEKYKEPAEKYFTILSENRKLHEDIKDLETKLFLKECENKELFQEIREVNTKLRNERNKEQIEKDKAKAKLLEKKKQREIEKLALQELIDEGEIFPEANKRPPIPRDVVDAVWNRDHGKCVYCGSDENLHLDHIIPFSKGGDTSVENLQLLCQKCNLEKSNKIG